MITTARQLKDLHWGCRSLAAQLQNRSGLRAACEARSP